MAAACYERRAVANKPSAKKSPAASRDKVLADARAKQPDPMSALDPKRLGLRVGIPVLIGWVLAIVIGGWIPPVVMGVITVAIGGVLIWVLRYARRTQAVVDLVKKADTAEARKEAISKLETDFKDDAAGVMAKAQLQMQDDPREALKTLETIKLDKVMAPVADEARIQRAMIHLLYGETENARELVDKVDIERHKVAKSRATVASVIAEAWARSGQAKKAVDLLETLKMDAELEDVKPQILRSKAFAYAWANNTKQMKQVLRELQGLNPQYLAGFITKKKVPGGVSPRGVHPILEKEAFDMLSRSGAMQRKMEFKRG